MVKCLLLNLHAFAAMKFDHFKRTGMKFDTGMKKGKNTCQHFVPGWNFTMFLLHFLRMYTQYTLQL